MGQHTTIENGEIQMKLRKRLIAAFAASTLLLSTGSAFAFRGDHHGKGHHDGKSFKRLLRGVDLTDEQKEQLRTLKMEQMQARKNNVIGGRENMLSQREQVKQLLLADAFDEQSVRLLAEEMVNQQTERR